MQTQTLQEYAVPASPDVQAKVVYLLRVGK